MNEKTCTRCGETKPLEEFYKSPDGRGGRTAVCIPCDARRTKKYRRENPERIMLTIVRNRAKRSGVPFNITLDDILIPKECPVLGIPLTIGDEFIRPNSPTLDRIIPELGYVAGNVAVISNRANRIKNDATLEELKAVTKWLEGIHEMETP